MRVLKMLAVAFMAMGLYAASDHPAAVAGIYESNVRIVGTAGRKVTLNLTQDGKASLRTELVGKSDMTDEGTWSANKDEVTVDIAGGGHLVWRLKKGRLSPKEWNTEAWGKSGVTLRRPR